MKRKIAVGLVTLFSFLFFRQHVFGHDFYRLGRVGFVAYEVRIGGGRHYRERCGDCGNNKRHDCRKHRGWKYRNYDKRYYRY